MKKSEIVATMTAFNFNNQSMDEKIDFVWRMFRVHIVKEDLVFTHELMIGKSGKEEIVEVVDMDRLASLIIVRQDVVPVTMDFNRHRQKNAFV